MSERTAALLAWYEANARDLPWRRTSDPWKILVSEVMLQQTQVGRVVDAFPRFLERFPDPASLTAASLAELIEAWDRLGYQRRVLNLQRAAVRIATDGWPVSSGGLRRLPGVGPYTAAAVACFAFGEPVAAIDTNLRRVLSRWTGRPLSGIELEHVATALLDRDHASQWNQALMDLGSARCRPTAPACTSCPVRRWCADPTVEIRTSRQTPYQGSVRQARAGILRKLAETGPVPSHRLAETLSIAPATLTAALAALRREGLLDETESGIGLVAAVALEASSLPRSPTGPARPRQRGSLD